MHAEILSRSATVDTLWVFRRHFAVGLFIASASEATWYQAGSWARSGFVSRKASMDALYFLAAFNILSVSLPIRSARLPLIAGFQDCRKGLFLAIAFIVGGAAVSISRSVTVAHSGRDGDRLR